MEMAGFRISIDLTNYYSDLRRKTYVYIDLSRYERIQDIERHIQELFEIGGDISLLVNEHYLPRDEKVVVLNEHDIIKVVPWPVTGNCMTGNNNEFLPNKVQKEMCNGISETEELLAVQPSYKKLKRKIEKDTSDFTDSDCALTDIDRTSCQEVSFLNDNNLEVKKKKRKKVKHEIKDENNVKCENLFVEKVQVSRKGRDSSKKRTSKRVSSNNEEIEHSLQNQEENYVHVNSDFRDKAVTCLPSCAVSSKFNAVVHSNTKDNQKEDESKHDNIVHGSSMIENVGNANEVIAEHNLNNMCNKSLNSVLSKNIQHSIISSIISVENGNDVSIDDNGKQDPSMLQIKKRRRRRQKKRVDNTCNNISEEVPVQNNMICTTLPTMVAKHIKFADSEDENDLNSCGTSTERDTNAIRESSVNNHNSSEKNVAHGTAVIEKNAPLKEGNKVPLVFHCHKGSMKKPDNSMSEMESDGIDYSKQPSLNGLPRENDIIAFKLWKLESDYTPGISKYIVANVLSMSEADMRVKLKILHGESELEEPKGKFSLETEDGEESEKKRTEDKIMNWSSLLDVKIIFP